MLFLVFALAAGAGTLKGFLDGDFAEENPYDVIPVSTQTEYDKDGRPLVEGTDYIQLYKEGQRDTLYFTPCRRHPERSSLYRQGHSDRHDL